MNIAEGQGSAAMGKHRAMIRLKGWMLSWVLRLQCLTCQIHIEGREQMNRLYAINKGFLLCFWHGKHVPIFPLLEGYEVCVVSSLSERGSVIAEICRNFGYQSILIPDQPRHTYFRSMVEALVEARAGAVAVDGPLGPRHRVKNGVIRIASALGFDLLPASMHIRRKIVCYKRWDWMEIPLPFTKVCLVIGEPIQVPPVLRSRQMQDWANHLAKAIEQLDKKAENMIRKDEIQKELSGKF